MCPAEDDELVELVKGARSVFVEGVGVEEHISQRGGEWGDAG